MDREEYLGWLYAGGGLELYNELLQKELKMNVVVPVLSRSCANLPPTYMVWPTCAKANTVSPDVPSTTLGVKPSMPRSKLNRSGTTA